MASSGDQRPKRAALDSAEGEPGHEPAKLISAEELVGPEWAEWYAMTPSERWAASQRLFAQYLALGGSLEPDVDTQSPFWSADDLGAFAQHRPIDRPRDVDEGER